MCASEFEEFDVKPTIFPYTELRTATRDFHDDMKLGQGGYGAVYKVLINLSLHLERRFLQDCVVVSVLTIHWVTWCRVCCRVGMWWL